MTTYNLPADKKTRTQPSTLGIFYTREKCILYFYPEEWFLSPRLFVPISVKVSIKASESALAKNTYDQLSACFQTSIGNWAIQVAIMVIQSPLNEHRPWFPKHVLRGFLNLF